ncbi:chemotaxis protein CheD [Celeribacter sp.]|uniref:chemotaxis protein CheD n=1 Tax=Celeribacter sp. TaxID=1890673 RepID=UPI003A8CCBD3
MIHAEISPKSSKNTYITQGEYAVSSECDAVISTILGSCVATCLWDAEEGIGGMNHFLLPEGAIGQGGTDSFGANAMELLINGLIQKGACRKKLQAKVFGGAALRQGLTSVGRDNGQFVLDYLSKEGIPCISQSLGGTSARRIEFEPVSGNARQKLVTDHNLKEVAPPPPPSSDIELF